MKPFEFGLDAQTTPENQANFNDRRDEVIAAIRPANIVEQILADELIHAGWEMEQVRTHAEDAEAAPILEEGIAAKASDVDMVYITGYGFPMHRGGPMLYADQFGLFNVVQTMRRFAQNPLDDATFWKPAPLLA